MSRNREPIQIVEIDMDFCDLTYGTSPCAAILGTTGVRKCYNTYGTCQSKTNFTRGVKTLRFVSGRASLPKDNLYFPVLDSVSTFSSTVNIAGSDEKFGALGKRARVTVNLTDFPYNDAYTDKYQAQRISGAAQTDESGYVPKDRGSFFSKLKARWPHYNARPIRVIDAYIDDGILDVVQTRHFIITEFDGPDDRGKVTISGKDILALADDNKAKCPKASRGVLKGDIREDATSLILYPEGIGNLEYPASGYAILGSEIVTFTRSGDTVTLTARGMMGTTVSQHNQNDTFQLCYVADRARIDDVLYDLFVDYAKVDTAFIPFSEWQAEITRWMGSVFLTGIVTEPTGVLKLLGELAALGISVWWDDTAQKIKLKCNRPVDYSETAFEINDRDDILAIQQEDQNDKRLTQIHFYYVISDPTGGDTDKSNYDRIYVTLDTDAETENAYRESRVKEIFFRWFNLGNESTIRVLNKRFLTRFNTVPALYTITLDAKDANIGLADVILLETRSVVDETGKPQQKRLQVINKTESKSGHEIKITAQAFQWDINPSFVMEDTANPYATATDLEKEKGCYIVDGTTLLFPDGRGPYKLT